MTDRHLKSYDDIADYIVEKLQFAQVNALPDEFFDQLAPYGATQSVAPFFTRNQFPVRMEFVWTPPSSLRIVFVGINNEIIQQFNFYRASTLEVPE